MAKKRKLRQELSKFARKTEKPPEIISGALGIYIGGKQYVDIPTRPGYVFVRLRNNMSELIQAHNQTVSPIYDLPVLVVWNHNRYEIYGRDSEQYGSYWDTSSSFLPKHGFQHEFDPDNNGGGDLVFVHGEQFYPMMTFPSGTDGANTVLIAPYRYFYQGLWRYTGNTGVGDLLALGPTGGNNAKLLLVGVTSATGNPFIKQGSEFSEGITGAAALTQFVPTNLTPIDEIPGGIIRLVTGTETITWANIYDARQYMGILQAGSGTAGVSTFLGLTDTPNSYSGQADKLLVVNSAETAVEFRTNTGTSGSPYTDVLQVQITGSVNNLNPVGMSTALVLELISDGNATYTISGIAGGANGRILYVNNNSPFQTCILIFDNENLSSSPNNRFYFSIDHIIIGPQEGIILIYDGVSNNGWNIFGEHRQRGQWNLGGKASVTLTGTTNNYNQFTTAEATVLFVSGTVASTLTGINPTDAISNEGKILLIQNIGTTVVTLAKESNLSTDIYRFALPSDIPIPPNGGVSIRYDQISVGNSSARWRPIDFTITGSGGGATDFLSLTDTPDSYSGQGGKLVAVNTGTTGLEFVSSTITQINSTGIMAWDEGTPLGTGTVFNFRGDNIVATISGTVVDVYVTGSGGSGGGMTLISQITPQNTSTGTFSNIPSSYATLKLFYAARSTAVATNVSPSVYFNQDYTSANYRRTVDFGFGASSVGSDGASDATIGGVINGASSPADSFSMGEITIPFYAYSSFNKELVVLGAHRRDTNSIFMLSFNTSLEWFSKNAISNIDIVLSSGNFVSGSVVRLYGVS